MSSCKFIYRYKAGRHQSRTAFLDITQGRCEEERYIYHSQRLWKKVYALSSQLNRPNLFGLLGTSKVLRSEDLLIFYHNIVLMFLHISAIVPIFKNRPILIRQTIRYSELTLKVFYLCFRQDDWISTFDPEDCWISTFRYLARHIKPESLGVALQRSYPPFFEPLGMRSHRIKLPFLRRSTAIASMNERRARLLRRYHQQKAKAERKRLGGQHLPMTPLDKTYI